MGQSVSASTDNIPGEVRTVSTHLGDISVRIIGSLDKNQIPVVLIPGANPSLLEEWVPTAEFLSLNGYVSCILNFHENPSTKPGIFFGGIHKDDVSRIISESIIRELFHTEKAIIMGKSWGGFMASSFAISNPSQTTKLVLIAPAYSNQYIVLSLRATRIVMFLGWAKDDSIVFYSASKTWTSGLGSQVQLYTADSGGHKILKEYEGPILEYLRS